MKSQIDVIVSPRLTKGYELCKKKVMNFVKKLLDTEIGDLVQIDL